MWSVFIQPFLFKQPIVRVLTLIPIISKLLTKFFKINLGFILTLQHIFMQFLVTIWVFFHAQANSLSCQTVLNFFKIYCTVGIANQFEIVL